MGPVLVHTRLVGTHFTRDDLPTLLGLVGHLGGVCDPTFLHHASAKEVQALCATHGGGE